MKAALTENVAEDCANLRQGDVIEADADIEPIFEGSLGALGVVVLSQTCDVVQPSKTRCLVAPVISVDRAGLLAAQKGRKPLHLYLPPDQAGEHRVADLEHAASLPKAMIIGRPIRGRHVPEVSSKLAGQLAARVGRAFSRFPFPDEVYPIFKELRGRVQSKTGTPSPFGQVVDLVDDLRVGADQWTQPARHLKLYVIVPERFLANVEDLNADWIWNRADVAEGSAHDQPGEMELSRVCELILANAEARPDVQNKLWAEFGERIHRELLQPFLDSEVVSFTVEVVSDSEMSYRDFMSTESLDLEVLSDSRLDD